MKMQETGGIAPRVLNLDSVGIFILLAA